MHRYRNEVLISVGLALLTLAAFWPLCTRQYGFVNFDDDDYVRSNRHVQAGLTPASISWALTTFTASNWHPLTWLSLQLDYHLHGLNPRGFHLTNLLLHTANVVLLFLVLWRMTGARWRSAAVAALFAVHPLHVESVAWISERKDVLSTLFWMATLGIYTAYARRPHWSIYLVLIIVYALGLMAKPMLVTLPCVLLLLDYWPLGRWPLGTADARVASVEPRTAVLAAAATAPSPTAPASPGGLLLEKVPLFALAAASSLLTLLAQHEVVKTAEEFPLRVRLLNVPVAYVTYLRKLVWPSDLAVLYPHPAQTLAAGWSIAAAVLLIVVTGLVLAEARRWPYLAVGWLWYLGTLVPVIGLVQVGLQAVADRYTYVPLIGIFLALSWGIADLVGRKSQAAVLLGSATAVLLVLCLLRTWVQVRTWRSSLALWENTVAVTSANPVAEAKLGETLVAEAQTDQLMGKSRDAEEKAQAALNHLEEAVRLDPNYVLAQCALADLLVKLRQIEQAKEHYRAAIRANPRWLPARVGLGLALAQQGNIEEAVTCFRAALEIEPDSPTAHVGLGQCLLDRGRLEEAARHFAAALEQEPDSDRIHHYLGVALLSQGKAAKAVPHLAEIVRQQPRLAPAHTNLGAALWECGRTEAADEEFARATALDPDWQERANRAAWAYATHPEAWRRNAVEAMQFARTASHASHDQRADYLDTLAAAYAEAGRFDDAVRTARKAISLALAGGQTGRAEEIKQRLRLYEGRKPFRDARLSSSP